MQPYLPLPGVALEVRCEHCQNVVPQPFYVVKHFGRMTVQLPFCDELCHELYYRKKCAT